MSQAHSILVVIVLILSIILVTLTFTQSAPLSEFVFAEDCTGALDSKLKDCLLPIAKEGKSDFGVCLKAYQEGVISCDPKPLSKKKQQRRCKQSCPELKAACIKNGIPANMCEALMSQCISSC